MTPEATTPSATAAPTMATARVLIRRLVISPYEPMACHTDVTYSTRGRRAVGETARPQRLHGAKSPVRTAEFYRSSHRGSKPAAIQACLTAGEVRNAISALAASGCVLSELIPAKYKE